MPYIKGEDREINALSVYIHVICSMLYSVLGELSMETRVSKVSPRPDSSRVHRCPVTAMRCCFGSQITHRPYRSAGEGGPSGLLLRGVGRADSQKGQSVLSLEGYRELEGEGRGRLEWGQGWRWR